ncbi:hypothetical protein AGMMS49936_11540 [Endomicrobiia bacterium]|nr:hypothetical protein AGMMS49936_11540 [Endomicrobiia bacterium]
MKLTYHQSKSNRSLKAISAIVLFGFLCLSSCDKKNAFLVNRRIATPEKVEEIKRAKAKDDDKDHKPLQPESKRQSPPFTEDNWTSIRLHISTTGDNKCYYYTVDGCTDTFELSHNRNSGKLEVPSKDIPDGFTFLLRVNMAETQADRLGGEIEIRQKKESHDLGTPVPYDLKFKKEKGKEDTEKDKGGEGEGVGKKEKDEVVWIVDSTPTTPTPTPQPQPSDGQGGGTGKKEKKKMERKKKKKKTKVKQVARVQAHLQAQVA